jgi:hypothetical protein
MTNTLFELLKSGENSHSGGLEAGDFRQNFAC